jgi:hypothetical protein
MNDCKHQIGFQVESCNLAGAGFVYIVRCHTCHAVVGVVAKDENIEIREIQTKLANIEALLMNPK